MVAIALLVLGISGLWIGTKLAVGGAARIAQRFRISQAVIGLTILAIGTDLPELIVAISAGVDKLDGADTSGIAIGNAVGSAVTQITLVLGLAGLTGALAVARRDLVRAGVATVAAVAFAFIVVSDGSVTRVEGGLLLLGYAAYLGWLLTAERTDDEPGAEELTRPWWLDTILIVAGLAVVVVGAEFVVSNGVELAERWGVDQTLVAVLVIALGTSLPEMAVSLRAAVAGKAGLSIGNIAGSNIFDLMVPVGTAAVIAGLKVERAVTFFDLSFLLAVSLVALFSVGSGNRLGRREAAVMIGSYALYVALRSGAEAL